MLHADPAPMLERFFRRGDRLLSLSLFGDVLDAAARKRDLTVGVVGIRVLAAGALTGTAERHPTASAPPAPIGSAHSYEVDLERARRLMPLVSEGYAGSLAEAAIRFVISHPAMGSILVGMATVAEFEGSLAAVQKGPLPAAALERVRSLSANFVGEAR